MNAAIHSILARGPEASFDRTTRLVARLLQVPVALVSFVDESRQVFKAQVGLPEPWATMGETPLSHSFCKLVVRSGEPLRVTDATTDERLGANRAIVDLGVAAYLGAPLRLGSGELIGAVCAIDLKPRDWSSEDLLTLEDLAASVVSEIELRIATQIETEGRQALGEAQRLLGMAEELAGIGRWSVELPSMNVVWSPQVFRIYGLEPALAAPDIAACIAAYHPDDRDRVQQSVQDAIETSKPFENLCRLQRPDGSIRHVLAKGEPNVDRTGLVTGISGIFLDVTELKVAEDELRHRGQVLEATLDNMQQGLLMVGPDRIVQTSNRRFRELLDLPETIMAGTPQFDTILAWLIANGEYDNLPGDQSSNIRTHHAELTPGTYERIRPNGRWLEVSTTPMAGGGIIRTYTDVTDRKEADESRRTLQEQFRIIAEQSGDLITVKPKFDGPRAYVSPSVRRILGFEPEEFTLLQPEEIVHPEDMPRLRREIANLGKTETSVTLVYRMRRKDGAWIWMEATWSESHSELAGPCLLVSGRDVSERVEIERARIESEARYRLLAETTSDVITKLDLDLRRQYVSPSCTRLLGYSASEMLGAEPPATMHPDDIPRFRQLTRKLIAGQAANGEATITNRMRHKDGRWIWIEARLTLAMDVETGRPDSIICSLRDVTERKLSEEALAESESRFRLLAENTNDMIILADLDTTRRYVSPASMEILGYHPEELLGSKPLASVHPEDIEHSRQLLIGLQSGDVESGSSRQRLHHKNGSWVWVETIFRLLRGPDGLPNGYVAAVRDISERQRHENDLKTAMAAAEAASRAKTDFLATMSHEIRTPLNGILGFTDMLMEAEDLSSEHRRKLSRIQSAGSALLTVVNDILDFSKIEAGQIEIAAEPFSLRALLDNATSIVKAIADARHLSLTVDCGASVPDMLVGDEARIRQILLNFLNNAIKFTPEGAITVTVVSEGGRGATRALRFAVTDTGIGIPADKLDRLFQRFSQVDGSIARTYGGTGLGLAISKNLIRLMGGEVGVHSEEGEGSTFWFRIKLAEAAPDAVAVADAPVLAPTRRLRILLAEDLDINQEIAARAIQTLGHEVDVVPDGASAVMAAETGGYDVILMDVQMPVMDGMTATRLIREKEAGGRRVPIVAMTANVLPSQISSFRAAGMDGHIGKPFKRADLGQVLAVYSARSPFAEAAFDAVETPGSVPAFDEPTYAELAEALGVEDARSLLVRLDAQVGQARDWSVAMGRDELGASAHKLVSPTGMMGFLQLSVAAANLEAACLSGEAPTAVLAEFHRVLDEAMALIRQRTHPAAAAA